MLLHETIIDARNRFPDHVAIESNKESITYEELDCSSDQIAQFLVEDNIKTGDKAAILMEKSIEAVTAFLGVLKSGGCYIPMDISAPTARLQYIIKDAKVKYIIVDMKRLKLAQELRAEEQIRIIVIGDDGENIPDNNQLEVLFCNKNSNDNSYISMETINENELAYILYTSGSTGTPKGVSITHRNAVCFVNWAYEYFQVNSDDVLSSHAPFYFDLSVFDIYVALKAGGRLCLLPPAVSAFPSSLAEYIAAKGITIWYSVPSVLVKLLQYGNLSSVNLSRLRKIIYAGESLAVKYLHQLCNLLPAVQYYNLYGPTETNVITYYHINPKTLEGFREIPIGRACPYAGLWVITEDNKAAGIGEKGELIVQSETLMPGYHNARELTDNVIKEVNIEGIPPGEYYHTGDIVLIVEDGVYQFVCRKDNMVKVNGFRIEIEEIETVLRRNPHISECIVKYVNDSSMGNHLKAYIQSTHTLEAEEVIRFAKQYLPEYMIPYDIQFIETFEYTERGKIARSML